MTALLILAGCGGSNKTSTTSASRLATTSTATTTTTTSQPTTSTTNDTEGIPSNEKVQLSSTAIPPEGAIPVRYTCNGQDTPPPLSWETPPPGTVELMLDVIKLKPVNDKLDFAWAITGIKPSVHHLNPPRLPAGVIVGTNSSGRPGYYFCPPKGHTENYVAALFALPRHLPAKPGFNATRLRLEAEKTAHYESLYIFHYTRH
jgi:phosphatidylethanolamine-binding protein (PEBP) family uncharacterized protein